MLPILTAMAPSIFGSLASSAIGGFFSKSSAKDQMDFQAGMSGTAHQREIADLKRAGLNPILSAKYGGASTPPGAGYEVPNIGQALQNSASAANLAKQNQVLDREVAIAKEQEKLIKRFPAIAGASILKDVDPATLAAVQAYMTLSGGENGQGGSNSAKSFGAKVLEAVTGGMSVSPDGKRYYDETGKPKVYPPPVQSKKKTKEQIKKELIEKYNLDKMSPYERLQILKPLLREKGL